MDGTFVAVDNFMNDYRFWKKKLEEKVYLQ